MRSLLAIVLLALLPLQFSWAALAPYCEHGTTDAGHLGHHAHPAHAGDGAEPAGDTNADAVGDAASGSVDVEVDCGHSHGHCSGLLMPHAGLPDLPSRSPPGATAAEAGSAQAPARPERPQWPPLA